MANITVGLGVYHRLMLAIYQVGDIKTYYGILSSRLVGTTWKRVEHSVVNKMALGQVETAMQDHIAIHLHNNHRK